jgi:hypothetical protein
VRRRLLEEYAKTDLPELDTDSDNHHAGNDRREKLSQSVTAACWKPRANNWSAGGLSSSA